jgi:hypothetical protein
MKCFVIMPFGQDNSNEIYEEWIKDAVEETEFNGRKIRCHRADKSLRPGEIIKHIIENLIDSEIVIADLTGRNPNVFYELGVRHTLTNNTILISQDINDIPFDLRLQQIITYKYDPGGMRKLKMDIRNSILSILESQEEIDNPVRKYLLEKEIKKFLEGSNLPGFNLIESLLEEVNGLKKNLADQFLQISSVIEKIAGGKQSDTIQNVQNISSNLYFFEGGWYNTETESTHYAKVINEVLYIPYCYAGNDELTAHYFNLKLIDDTLIGRFEWFQRSVYGFSFFKIIDNDTIEGGWWYAEDMPKQNFDNYWAERGKIGNMVKSKRVRIKNLTYDNYPEWAKEYFKKKELFP